MKVKEGSMPFMLFFTLRSAIPIRFACAGCRKTPVFVRSGVQKHVEFQVGLYCNNISESTPATHCRILLIAGLSDRLLLMRIFVFTGFFRIIQFRYFYKFSNLTSSVL